MKTLAAERKYSVYYQSVYFLGMCSCLLIKFTMQSKKNDSAAQEESPVEATLTVSLKEYQMLRTAAINREHAEKCRKRVSCGPNPDEMSAGDAQSLQKGENFLQVKQPAIEKLLLSVEEKSSRCEDLQEIMVSGKKIS